MSNTKTDDFYGSLAWKKLRTKMKCKTARCALCGILFVREDMKVVDHIKPRRLFPELALVESNLQVCHKLCHDSVKSKMEKGREVPLTGADGWPID